VTLVLDDIDNIVSISILINYVLSFK